MKILLVSSLILIGLLFLFMKKSNNEEKYNVTKCDLNTDICCDPNTSVCCDESGKGNCWISDNGDKVWIFRKTPVKANESHKFSTYCTGKCTAEDGNEIFI